METMGAVCSSKRGVADHEQELLSYEGPDRVAEKPHKDLMNQEYGRGITTLIMIPCKPPAASHAEARLAHAKLAAFRRARVLDFLKLHTTDSVKHLRERKRHPGGTN